MVWSPFTSPLEARSMGGEKFRSAGTYISKNRKIISEKPGDWSPRWDSSGSQDRRFFNG